MPVSLPDRCLRFVARLSLLEHHNIRNGVMKVYTNVSLLRSFYSTYVKPVSTRLGLHEYLREIYWTVKIFRNRSVEQSVDGTTVQFGVNNKSEFLRFKDLGGERAIIEGLLSELQRDDVVFDVGANVGTYTCFLSQKIPASQIIAFEPHPTNLDGLRSNLRRNDSDATIIEKALADSEGTAELEVVSSDVGEGKHSLATDEASETIEIELATGDRLVDDGAAPQPTIVKVDVEGAEGRVLAGLKTVLSRPSCRLCYVEVHPNRLQEYGDTESDIVTELEDRGFDVAKLRQRGSEYFLKAKK